MKKVLILGSQGTLGTALVKLYPEGIGWDRDDIDVTDFPALRAKVSGAGYTPDAVINCVAFNDVDGAEERSELAFSLNADFPGRLAQFTKELGIPLVHYSTNYVFDGVRGEYAEADRPSPLSAYGRSKLQGERLVAENGGQWYIVRTAVLFGAKGNSPLSKKSFVEIMLDLSSKRRYPGRFRRDQQSYVCARPRATHARPAGILTCAGHLSHRE
jgi:dTDP-4-dehydrorhamnose reductase